MGLKNRTIYHVITIPINQYGWRLSRLREIPETYKGIDKKQKP